MSNFEKALKKGEIGEYIIRKYLEDKGWIVYSPFTKDKAHYFDMLCTYNKEKVMAIDVKTKARLNLYEAQGIDKKHYYQYINFTNKTNIPFYLIFIDDKLGDVHCADLKSLQNEIHINDKIIAWHLKDMHYLFNIGNDNINKLTELDQRNYFFNPL
jgi:Holliday junction resolvase